MEAAMLASTNDYDRSVVKAARAHPEIQRPG